jgi:hypothetical protein
MKAAILNGNGFDSIANEVSAGGSPRMEAVAGDASNLRARSIAVRSARWDPGKSFKATPVQSEPLSPRLDTLARTVLWGSSVQCFDLRNLGYVPFLWLTPSGCPSAP